MAAAPLIFSEDAADLVAKMKADFESRTGRVLAPADIEMLMINMVAYQINLVRITGNIAVSQMLVSFSTGIMLEYLGALVGVSRLPAQGAACTIRFTLVSGHNDVQIPAGIRVQSIDGKAIFQIIAAVDVPIGTDTADVAAICTTAGDVGNAYDVGKISIILDPQAFITTAQNIDITSGGIDAETDDQLRERISLAPASFSVAGPKGAYIFFAKSAHPSIVDVAPITTSPGTVTLYPLCEGGVLPSAEIKAAVLAICDDYKVRPQNDTVLVDDPDVVEYDIEVELTTYTGAINNEVLNLVNSNLQQFRDERQNKLGMDAVRSQISALAMIKDKVYDVNVISPAADVVADEKTYAKCTGISVTITGSNNG